MTDFETIRTDFEFLDDWEDRYRYIIELGRDLEPLDESERNDKTRVQGCVSQVWLVTEADGSSDPVLRFRGQSDAHIVSGLVAIVLGIYSGKTASEIEAIDALTLMREIGLQEHLSPQRANGLRAMIERIKSEAARLRQRSN